MITKYSIRFLGIIFAVLGFSVIAEARYAKHEDSSGEYEFYNSDTKVQAANKIETIEEFQVKILNEIGRERFGTQSFSYNSNMMKLKLIEAKTIIEGKEYKISAANIEDKPVASNVNGFDEIRRLQISFPKVAIGASVYVKIKYEIFKTALDNYFADRCFFGNDIYTKAKKCSFKSKIHFKHFINDPNNHLEVKKGNEGDYQTLDVTLKKPIYNLTIAEGFTVLPESKMTWVALSSLKNYEEISTILAPKYEAVINEKLPKMFEEIVDGAKLINNETDQINYVTSKLAEKVRYMGDWRTVKGQIYPRPFELVASTGYGDCKDFSSSTAAILKKLG